MKLFAFTFAAILLNIGSLVYAMRVLPGIPEPEPPIIPNFTVLAQSGISNVFQSVVGGNVGVSPITGAAITGLTCEEISGNAYAPDSAWDVGCTINDPPYLTIAVGQMEAAYTDLNTRPGGVSQSYASISASSTQEFIPGIYHWNTGLAVIVGGTIELNGGPTDLFIFQIQKTFDFGGQMVLLNGAKAENVFWVVAMTAHLLADSHVEGNVLSYEDITLVTGASVNGCLYAHTKVAMQMNTITGVGSCAGETVDREEE
jgi:hypothetical protein